MTELIVMYTVRMLSLCGLFCKTKLRRNMATCPVCGRHFSKGNGQTDWLFNEEYCSQICLDAAKNRHPKARKFFVKVKIIVIIGIVIYFWGKYKGYF